MDKFLFSFWLSLKFISGSGILLLAVGAIILTYAILNLLGVFKRYPLLHGNPASSTGAFFISTGIALGILGMTLSYTFGSYYGLQDTSDIILWVSVAVFLVIVAFGFILIVQREPYSIFIPKNRRSFTELSERESAAKTGTVSPHALKLVGKESAGATPRSNVELDEADQQEDIVVDDIQHSEIVDKNKISAEDEPEGESKQEVVEPTLVPTSSDQPMTRKERRLLGL